jgi:hypothetical protein
MLFSLPNGKVIEISIDQFFDMTDEDLEYLIGLNYGEAIQNPFFGSIIESPEFIDTPDVYYELEIPPADEIDNSIDFVPEED